jgi:hypothetical protein
MFDGYHKWLGIPKDQQPPTYYHLLGIAPDEHDPEVIRGMAARQTAHLKKFQAGPHAEQCARILNEVSEAKLVLLNPVKRAEYDARLARATTVSGIAHEGVLPTVDDVSTVASSQVLGIQTELPDIRPAGHRQGVQRAFFTPLRIAIGSATLIIIVVVILAGTRDTPTEKKRLRADAPSHERKVAPKFPEIAANPDPPTLGGLSISRPEKTEPAREKSDSPAPAEEPILSTAPPKVEPPADASPPAPVAEVVPLPATQVEPAPRVRLDRKQPDAEPAIEAGVRFLKTQQRPDGSWADVDSEAHTGATSLATLALLSAGEPVSSTTITSALRFLRNFGPELLKSTYAVSLQTMVFAAAEPDRDRPRLAANVRWLEDAQIKPGDRVNWPGSWTYSVFKTRNGDNSNTQYALLGLDAATEVGIPVNPEVWLLARRYWELFQHNDGGWGYTPDAVTPATASMTCAGISGLIVTELKRFQGQEFPVADKIKNTRRRRPSPRGAAGPESPIGDNAQNCGKGGININLERGIDWMANHFRVGENYGMGQQWRYYFLCGMERAGRLTGQRFFGDHDWYREAAEDLLRQQDKRQGSWRGAGPVEGKEPVGLVTTSFALMFLAKGRTPVLIQKAQHAPGNDWRNDPDDVRNLVAIVARDRKQALNWQIVDLDAAAVDDLLLAPVLFLNGHQVPKLEENGKKALRAYVERGGFVFAEACCGKDEFDKGFRRLVEEVFTAPESALHPLAADHPIWRAKHELLPHTQLCGLELGGRTVLIYSPLDLSCSWNEARRAMANPAVIKAVKLGENVVNYAVFAR